MGQRCFRAFAFALAGLVIPLITGCFSTSLPSTPQSDSVNRLVTAAEVQVPFYFAPPNPQERRGFQYLLVGLPFSSVYTPKLSSLVKYNLTVQAGLHRYGLVEPTSTQGMQVPRLIATVKDASVNAYDFIFFRRPVASITLAGTYYSQRGKVQECEVTGTHGDYKMFAFDRELLYALEKATEDAATKLIECLGLGQNLASVSGQSEINVS
jgi:hypothetical protein